MVDMEPVAMAVKKDKPLFTRLPHVKKVIDEAPPEYIIMVVVAFLHVFAMTISLVHVLNKHRAFNSSRPRMVFPTLAVLSFYWVVAALNMIGLVVIRANLLSQALCSCYDAVIGYMLAVLFISYADGKITYFTITRWRNVAALEYSCSTLCCWNSIKQKQASRGIAYVIQLIVVNCATSLGELICENEGLFFYPSPITNSYIILGLKAVQFVSLLVGFYGFFLLARAAAIMSPNTSPYLKLILFKCIYILSSIQNNVLVYMAFNKMIPKMSEIAPITRAVVWSNFGAVIECTIAYFIAVRLYKKEDYNTRPVKKCTLETGEETGGKEQVADGSISDLELDKQGLMKLKGFKLEGAGEQTYSLTDFDIENTSSDEAYLTGRKSKKGDLRKGSRTFRSAEGMLGPAKQHKAETKTARLIKREYSSVSRDETPDDDEHFEPKISIVGGKVNISLSSRDLTKLCKTSKAGSLTVESLPISLNLDELSDGVEEDDVIKRAVQDEEKRQPKSRHSMQFVRTFSYSKLGSGDEEEKVSDEDVDRTIKPESDRQSQYISKISLV